MAGAKWMQEESKVKVTFIEREEFKHYVAVVVNGMTIARLRERGSEWCLEFLDVIPNFWIGGGGLGYKTLEEAKEKTIKRFIQHFQ